MMSQDAYIDICEEPAPKLKRLRYRAEGTTAPIEGVRTSPSNKTFPSLKIKNYTGTATIIVSTVTADHPYRNHPHNLVGKKCEDGVYRIRDFYTDGSNPKVLSFPDLRIERCLRSEISVRLKERESLNINPFHNEHNGDTQRDIHSLRLCFQVLIQPDPRNPNLEIRLQPKVSQPITSRKFAAEMTIDDISDLCSPAAGGKKIVILCNKIDKDDIRIRFFEEDVQKKEVWIGWGYFEPHNVHADVAIAFQTPKYDRILVGKQPKIFIEMVRPSDNARSNRMPFQYDPDVININGTTKRKQDKINASRDFYEYMRTPPHQQYHIHHQNPPQPNLLPHQCFSQGPFNPHQLEQHIATEQLILSHQYISTPQSHNTIRECNLVQQGITQ